MKLDTARQSRCMNGMEEELPAETVAPPLQAVSICFGKSAAALPGRLQAHLLLTHRTNPNIAQPRRSIMLTKLGARKAF